MLFQKRVEITETDNGYVLEWRDDRMNEQRQFPERQRKTHGVEVCTSKDELMKRVKQLV